MSEQEQAKVANRAKAERGEYEIKIRQYRESNTFKAHWGVCLISVCFFLIEMFLVRKFEMCVGTIVET